MAQDPVLPRSLGQQAVQTLDSGPDTPWGLLTTTADGTIINVNARFTLWSGRAREALLGGLRWKQLLAPASRILYETHFVPRLEAQGAVSEVSLDLALAEGGRFPILASALRQGGEAEAAATVSITVFDATETRRFEKVLRVARRDAEAATENLAVLHRALRLEHERLRVMLRSIADAVVTSDAHGRITSFNPTAEEITGLSATQVVGTHLASVGPLLEAGSRRPIDLANLQRELLAPVFVDFLFARADGFERYLESTAAPLRDEAGQVEGCVFVWRDVTQKRADAAQRRFDITHDRLTQLFNRSEFERRIGLELAAARSVSALPHLLLHVGIDQFKIINDTVGATVGDDFLVEIAALLRQNLQRPHTLARLGGDEFGVLLPHCAVAEGVVLADALRCRIEEFPLRRDQVSHTLTASIGLAVLPESGGTADGALANAGMACQTAKEAGRNRVHIVEAEDTRLRQRREQMGWMTRLRSDLGEDRFELYFQPIVRVDGAAQLYRHGELLLRLRDDEGQVVPPGEFIGAAERYHKMGQVDRWVVGQAFDWLDLNPGVQVSINVSGQSFGDAKFLTHVVDRMAGRQWHPARVCFEITETAAIADLPAALRFIACLQERGCLFSLDDFGAGLSSFGYLRSLPVDFVKIDGSFVKSMVTDPVNRAIVESIHRVAKLCGMQTVAEWVEDVPTLTALREIGVDHAQGWGVGRPMSLRDVGMIDRDQAIVAHHAESSFLIT